MKKKGEGISSMRKTHKSRKNEIPQEKTGWGQKEGKKRDGDGWRGGEP